MNPVLKKSEEKQENCAIPSGGNAGVQRVFVITVAKKYHQANLPWIILYPYPGEDDPLKEMLLSPVRNVIMQKNSFFPWNGNNICPESGLMSPDFLFPW